jgi:hypothetical protein
VNEVESQFAAWPITAAVVNVPTRVIVTAMKTQAELALIRRA